MNPTTPEDPYHTDDELRDTCVKLQTATGIQDTAWKVLYGNDEGLYGFIKSHANQEVRQVLDRLAELEDGTVKGCRAVSNAIKEERAHYE